VATEAKNIWWEMLRVAAATAGEALLPRWAVQAQAVKSIRGMFN